MTTGLIEAKTNGSSLMHMDQETLSKLVLNGDLSKLSEEQTLEYYAYRCKAVGLDPGTKPFDLLILNGKKVMYATKECSAQISQRDKLSVTVVNDGAVGDIYRVVARASSPEGRATDDMGCVNIKGLSGDALCNAMMKATTKAKRRAILTHAGLGMMDETELETVPQTTTSHTVKKSTPVSREQTAKEAPKAPTGDAVEGNPEPTIIIDEPAKEGRPEGCERVGILKIMEKSGKKKDGSVWTRTGIEFSTGDGSPMWANTFSTTDGAIAKKCKENGLDAWVLLKKNGEYTDFTFIEAIEGDA